MNKGLPISLLLALVAFAALPGLAQAETKELVSRESNSLCINPTEKGFEPTLKGKLNTKPLTKSHKGKGAFPDEGTACDPPEGFTGLNHAIAMGPPGAHAGIYGGSITNASWVSFNSTGSDAANPPPRYYIYDEQFELCKQQMKGTTLAGGMFDDDQAGVFLNGKAIGSSGNNTGPTPSPFSTTTYFRAGVNTIQFVVLDSLGPSTGLDFSATVTTKARCPHIIWNPKSPIPAGTKLQSISWGRLTFATPIGPVTCKKSDAGNLEDPPGSNGTDETLLFDLYECSAGECPKGVTVTASGLPWLSELEETPVGSGVIRDKTNGIGLTVDCEGREFAFSGALAPNVVNRSGTTAPSFEEFDAEAGELAPTSKEGPNLEVTGNDYMRGFDQGHEVITAKAESCGTCE